MVEEKEKQTDIQADSESLNGPTETQGEGPLVRQLKNRHIAMISIGGVIGTGMSTRHTTNIFFQSPSRSLLGYRWRFATRWSHRSSSRLYSYGYYLLFGHGKCSF